MLQIIKADGTQTLLNPDHIIRAEYEPEHIVPAHVNDYGQDVEEHMAPASLVIVTTELETETASHWDGADYGVASKSKNLWLRGIEAEKVFEALTHQCVEYPAVICIP